MTPNADRAAGRVARRHQRTALIITAAAALAATGLPATATAAPRGHASGWHDVVVTGSNARAAADAVTAAGGRVLASLPVVRGVAARLPDGATLGPEWLVAAQRALRVASAETDPSTPEPIPAEPTGAQSAAGAGTPVDGAVSTVRETLGLPAAGNEGRGSTVVVVDTGIADVPDLAGKITDRVDLTGTGAGDGFGHGTFMAGLIAGTGRASAGAYRGVAPGANLVDVKVADGRGNTDLITVLRGLQWVSEHAQAIDVLNLSLSSYSPLPYQVDPLTQGLEALWRRGVTVVVPSGNDGPDAGTVTSPGVDPVLLTAGGLDEAGSAARSDDTVGRWSGRGPTWQGDAKPDLVAPGAHLVGLRAPGSTVDTENPGSRIGDGYFRGSGTSMSTAVTSGVVAAVLAEHPNLRPDAVKDLLIGTAYAEPGLTSEAGAGAGGLDASAALAAAPGWRGSPDRARADSDAAVLRGDAQAWTMFEQALLNGDRPAAAAAWKRLSDKSREWAGRTWAQLDPATREWAGRAWAGRAWASGPDGTAEEWAGRAWAGRAWAGRAWADAEWAGRAWAGRAWAGRAWADAEWAGRAWAGRAWADAEWAGRAWAGRAWADAEWADGEWAGRAWAGRAWAEADWAEADWAGRAWAGRAWAGRAWADAGWVAGDWTGRAWASSTWSGRAWAWLR